MKLRLDLLKYLTAEDMRPATPEEIAREIQHSEELMQKLKERARKAQE